jgi:hypothetical protein
LSPESLRWDEYMARKGPLALSLVFYGAVAAYLAFKKLSKSKQR